MLIGFFDTLRRSGLPVSIREFLDLLSALRARVAFADMHDFYYLSRTCLVKDESHFDRFDLAFQRFFRDLETLDDVLEALIPEDWLRQELQRYLTEEEREKLESLGSLEALIEEFRRRLASQEERHEGGNRWIGTGGTSPFGQGGYHPEGIRVGPDARQGRAVKVWERRDYRNLDDSIQLGTRNIKMALRRLRQFARAGSRLELDMPDTIRSTARNAGLLDIRMVPERHNAAKVLLFLDVGGSMDPYVRQCEELFSAARSEFKHLEYFYFHNFIYDTVWKDNYRRASDFQRTFDVLHKYSRDYKVIFVGDAAMSTYEILQAGGSVEYWNDEPGIVWMQRFQETFDKVVWLNPLPERAWGSTQSIGLVSQLVEDRMYPLTLKGLEDSMAWLAH